MSVLTLAGKPINWAKPPKPATRVIWSQRTAYGGLVQGSFRSICHLDHLNTLAIKKFGRGIVVYQSAYNTTVAASKGTHDKDACFDVWIPGVPGLTQQAFIRANGGGDYYRTKAQGFSLEHQHYFCLPPRRGVNVSDDYKENGLKVGYLVDGGWSMYGRVIASSQIGDYYSHKDATSLHRDDPTWFPPSIPATIFDLDAYVERQRKATAVGHLTVLTANIASKARVPELPGVLKNQNPHVAVITEAYHARKFLRSIPGYRNLQYARKKYGSEGPDVALLVRKGVKVSRRRALKMALEWVGPQGGEHDGRVYPSINVRVDDFWWRVLGIHFPTRNNPKAQDESERAVEKWLLADERRGVASGDYNQTSPMINGWLPKVADLAVGTKVDHTVFKGDIKHTKTIRLAKAQPEGMHGWVVYKFVTD